jgi:hypothetical protein
MPGVHCKVQLPTFSRPIPSELLHLTESSFALFGRSQGDACFAPKDFYSKVLRANNQRKTFRPSQKYTQAECQTKSKVD